MALAVETHDSGQYRYVNGQLSATYQKTTTNTALIDVSFDLSQSTAAKMFSKVVAQSNLDELLTTDTKGVSLNLATLSHTIKRMETVELHMPFFDFSSTHVNDAMVNLTAEDHGGRLLLYQIDAKDRVTVANRMASQLSLMASLTVKAGQVQFDTSAGSITYEMRQIKKDMRPDDLEQRTKGFIREYMKDLFSSGDSSLQSFYTDLDIALTTATHNPSNQLGDIALSMLLGLPASVLSGWFRPRAGSHLHADQLLVSQALQTARKKLLPALFFQDLDRYQFDPAVASLLVWTSLPLSTRLDPQQQTAVFWDFLDVNVRRRVVHSNSTASTLAGRLAAIHDVLQQQGNNNAEFFVAAKTGKFIQMALDTFVGDEKVQALLTVERDLVEGAAAALKKLSEVTAQNTAAGAPTIAIKSLSEFAATLTNTFNNGVTSVYAGNSSRVLGPMLLVEASNALGSGTGIPDALLKLYALTPGHTFTMGTFVDGTMPPQAEVALSQALVKINTSSI
jgi:hypothetical protein